MTARVSPYPGAQAVSRAVAVLKAFTDIQPKMTLADITRATRLNKATAYRLLAALEKEGLIAREGAPKGGEAYRLGPEAIALGGRALRANDLRSAAHAELETLAQATRETATLEMLVGRDMLIVDEVISPNLVGGTPFVGTRWPAHATSTGKAVLAHLPTAELNSFLRRALPGFTGNTLTAPEKLRRELARVRERGFATLREELEVGYAAAGAAIFNHDGRVVGALSVGGPAARLTEARLNEIGPRVAEAAERVSVKLGFQINRK